MRAARRIRRAVRVSLPCGFLRVNVFSNLRSNVAARIVSIARFKVYAVKGFYRFIIPRRGQSHLPRADLIGSSVALHRGGDFAVAAPRYVRFNCCFHARFIGIHKHIILVEDLGFRIRGSFHYPVIIHIRIRCKVMTPEPYFRYRFPFFYRERHDGDDGKSFVGRKQIINLS